MKRFVGEIGIINCVKGEYLCVNIIPFRDMWDTYWVFKKKDVKIIK